MKTINTIAVAATVTASIAFAASANAVPTGGSTVDDIVMSLQEQGNKVVVNRTGSQPLSQCTVTGVRPGQTFTHFDSGYPGAGNDPMTQVSSMTVYVDAQC